MEDSRSVDEERLEAEVAPSRGLRFDEAAERLEVSVGDLMELVDDGAIRALVAGSDHKVAEDDVDRLVRALARFAALEPERLLTPAEVSKQFGVKTKTVAGWARAGKLPAAFTAGGHRRYRQSDVRRLLARREGTDDRSSESGADA